MKHCSFFSNLPCIAACMPHLCARYRLLRRASHPDYLQFSIWADKFCWRSAMLTEVRVDESAQPHSKDVQSDPEKGADPGLAEAMRAWVHRLLDRNDTNVHLVRMAPCVVGAR